MKEFKRQSGSTPANRKVMIDPRCWRTVYKVRLMLSQALGFIPSFDYALSEMLVFPVRGAALIKRADELYPDLACPTQYGPQGNRHSAAKDPNAEYEPGELRDDWASASGQRSNGG